jgi:hypothetical protein
MDMSKSTGNLMFLLLAAYLPMNSRGDELPLSHFNGMQLAWTSVTSTPAETDIKSSKKSSAVKPAPAQAPAPVNKPAQVIVSPAPATPAVKPAATARVKQVPSSDSRKHQAVQWMIGIGFDFGGDELGSVTYSDGSTASVKANNGIVVNIGTLISNGKDSAFSTQVSVGYKSGGPRLWNRDVNWSAIPIEIVEQYNSRNMRIGAGISYQLNPQLKVNVPTANFTTQYDNAIGLIAQIGWMPSKEHYSIDMRYTAIKFQVSGAPGTPLIDGNVGGLYLNYYY